MDGVVNTLAAGCRAATLDFKKTGDKLMNNVRSANLFVQFDQNKFYVSGLAVASFRPVGSALAGTFWESRCRYHLQPVAPAPLARR